MAGEFESHPAAKIRREKCLFIAGVLEARRREHDSSTNVEPSKSVCAGRQIQAQFGRPVAIEINRIDTSRA